jgi:hypothetical protein
LGLSDPHLLQVLLRFRCLFQVGFALLHPVAMLVSDVEDGALASFDSFVVLPEAIHFV